MRLAIFGASGGTGQELLQQALARGDEIRALVRNPAKLTIKSNRLHVVPGDILDKTAVSTTLEGCEAALSTLGVNKLGKNTILSDGTRNIIEAMQAQQVKRFICLTSLGVGDSFNDVWWGFRWVTWTLMRNIFRDKEIQEQLVKHSSLDWIIVRPTQLVNGARTGKYSVWLGRKPAGLRDRIRRADVADFMLAQTQIDHYLRKTPGISS